MKEINFIGSAKPILLGEYINKKITELSGQKRNLVTGSPQRAEAERRISKLKHFANSIQK